MRGYKLPETLRHLSQNPLLITFHSNMIAIDPENSIPSHFDTSVLESELNISESLVDFVEEIGLYSTGLRIPAACCAGALAIAMEHVLFWLIKQ
jgi:hypothetical protein